MARHHHGNAIVQPGIHSFYNSVQCLHDEHGILFVEILQHVSGGVHTPRRPTNPKAQACEFGCTYVLDNAFETLLPTRAALFADTQRPGWNIHVVADHQQMAQRNLIECHQALHCFSAQIHKGLRFRQQNLASGNGAIGDERFGLSLSKGKPMRVSDVVHASEADVMPWLLIFTTGVSQPNYQITISHTLLHTPCQDATLGYSPSSRSWLTMRRIVGRSRA